MSFQIGVNHLIELLSRTGSSFLEPRRCRRSTQNVFMRQWSFNSTSFVSSLFLTLNLFRIKSNIPSALARQMVVHGRACVFVSIFLLFARQGRSLRKEMAAGFDPSDFRANAHKACINPQDHDALIN